MKYFYSYYKTIGLIILLNYFINIINAGKGEPPEIEENIKTHYKIPIGAKSFKLSCPVKENLDKNYGFRIRWSKDDEEISSTELNLSSYRLLNANRDLKIRNPQVSNSGLYKCMVINGFGHKEVSFTLQIYDPNHLRYIDPNESVTLSDKPSSPIWFNRNSIDLAIKTPIQVFSGKRLELKCPASGNPLPKIYWTKDDYPISLELTNPSSAKLVINNVDELDSGTYTCRLENNYGSLEADFKVFVKGNNNNNLFISQQNIDKKIPNIGTFGNDKVSVDKILTIPPPQPTIDEPYNSSVRAGHTAQFQCKVQWQKDFPTIRWLRRINNAIHIKKNEPNATILFINNMHLLVLEQKNDAIQFLQHNASKNSKSFVNKLLIQNVQKENSGQYFCVVSNAAGQFVYRSAYLNVVDDFKFAPLATTTNIAVITIIVFVITLVTVSILWLCSNSAAVNKTLSSEQQQFSSNSSTSSSTSSSKYPKYLNSVTIVNDQLNGGLKRAILSELPPPPPKIPLPAAPPNSLKSAISNNNFNRGFNYVINSQPQSSINLNDQNYFQQHQFFDNHFINQNQTHFHNNVNSPLLFNNNVHYNSKLNKGIGELLYPSSVTLDRRYLNHRYQMPNQQHILHRTKADDEMSRLSSHIYDILATNSPIPFQNNLQTSSTPKQESFSKQQQNWCNKNYAPPPAPPFPTNFSSVERSLTPIVGENENYMKRLCKNNNHSQKFLQYAGQQ